MFACCCLSAYFSSIRCCSFACSLAILCSAYFVLGNFFFFLLISLYFLLSNASVLACFCFSNCRCLFFCSLYFSAISFSFCRRSCSALACHSGFSIFLSFFFFFISVIRG